MKQQNNMFSKITSVVEGIYIGMVIFGFMLSDTSLNLEEVLFVSY